MVSQHFLLPKRFCALVVLWLLVSGCATRQQQTPPSLRALPEPSTKAEHIPQTLTVSSVHGTHQIIPTVVGANAPPAKQNGSTADSKQPIAFTDPLEWLNRPIFAFNDVLYRYFLIPISHGYQKIVPAPVQTGISHFFANLREPINGINNLLQGNGTALGHNVSRLLINSTIGILGLFDPAKAWFGIEPKVEHINDTLRNYDLGYGSYLVLPFLGSSDIRNGFSTIAESIVSPVHQISDNPQTYYLQVVDGLHQAVPRLITYEALRQNKEDPYAFFRNLYMQGVLRDQQFPQQEHSSIKVNKQPVTSASNNDRKQP